MKVLNMLMEEAGQETGGGGTGTETTGQETGQQTGQQNSQYVPYERFTEVNTKYKDLEGKYKNLEDTLSNMKNALNPDEKKGFKIDYTNPDKSIEEYISNKLKEQSDNMTEAQTKKERETSNRNAVKWFKEQEDYTPELEEKAARFITENGLHGIDAMKGIKLAYKFVTMGEGSGYTRSVKEGLKKPSGGNREKQSDFQSEMAALNPTDEKYEEKMKAIHNKFIGG